MSHLQGQKGGSLSQHALTADRLGSAEDLLDGAAELFCEGLVSHGAGDLNDVVERDVAGVNASLLLLAVSGGLLEGADDEGGGGGHNGDGGLTVLDGELNGHAETFPVAGGLGDVFTDFFGGLEAGWARDPMGQPLAQALQESST